MSALVLGPVCLAILAVSAASQRWDREPAQGKMSAAESDSKAGAALGSLVSHLSASLTILMMEDQRWVNSLLGMIRLQDLWGVRTNQSAPLGGDSQRG
jgi:hypothetical protein